MLSEQEVVKWFGSRGCFALYGFAVVYVGLKFRCLMFYLTDKTTHKLGKFCSSNTQDNSGCNETTSKYVCLFLCLFVLSTDCPFRSNFPSSRLHGATLEYCHLLLLHTSSSA